MTFDIFGLKIGIVGGSDPCVKILDMLTSEALKELDVRVAIVVDTWINSSGMVRARALEIPTSSNYKDVCDKSSIDLILKLKHDEKFNSLLDSNKLCGIRLIDFDDYHVMSFLNFLEIKENMIRIQRILMKQNLNKEETFELFNKFSNNVLSIINNQAKYLIDERETLLEIEKELGQVIQGSMIPTFIINDEHIITHWNRACEELTGHRAYKLVGTDRQWVPFRSAKRPTMADVVVSQLSEEEVSRYYGRSWRKSKIIKEAYEAEEFFSHLGKNGKWILFSAAPIKSPDGKIIGAIETLLDKTEDQKAQMEIELQDRELAKLHEKYKRSEKQYRSLFNNNPNPIFIVDRETFEIVDVNDRVKQDYGYSKSEILGSSFLSLGEEESDQSIREGFKFLPLGKSILYTKKRHYKKSKESFFVNINAICTNYNYRDVFIVATTDITESVEKEAQLIQAGKLATLGTMAAGMAHEINQPLNVIQLCADLMLKMLKKGMVIPEDELEEIANDIVDNVSRAADVIKHVRDFSRQSERSLKKLNINDPIRSVFKVLGHQLAVHSILLDLDLDDNIPDILAEHNRLEQVFINLVTNAIDAMDEKIIKIEDQGNGSVEKKLLIKSFCKDNEVIIIVKDNGVGMSEAVKQKIFEPFFTTKGIGKGTGLGTSISFGIIKDYGGNIEIDSIDGRGAEFTITFPIAE